MENTEEVLSQIYGLVKYQGRAITAVQGERGKSKFLVGTCSLKDDNEVHLICYDDMKAEIDSGEIMHHGPEIWSLESCPTDADLFFSVYNKVPEKMATLWRIVKDESGAYSLQNVLDIHSAAGEVKRVIWSENESKSQNIIVLEKNNFSCYDVESEAEYGISKVSKTTGLNDIYPDELHQMHCASVDPHRRYRFLTATHTTIQGWDLRSMDKILRMEHAHASTIRDIDFNHNRTHFAVSCGDDNHIKLWDLRNYEKPVYEVNRAHSHWIWGAKFNPFHDQFVITSSSDTNVLLWSYAHYSSAEDSVKKRMGNRLVKKYDEHEDSVYGIAWSATDPYVFASFSYGGRVVLSTVPQEERKKCLDI